MEALKGSDQIIHAGDIGTADVIRSLSVIAPVHAIRGNIDRGKWAQALPENEVLEFLGKRFYVLHDVNRIDFDPASKGFDVVISGHSHNPKVHKENGVLFVNPGSAGPRRFRLPVAVATLCLSTTGMEASVLRLKV